MNSGSAIRESLGLTEDGVDLAKLIFKVAGECDTTRAFNRSINLSGVCDEILLRLEILSIQQKNPHLSEDEIQKRIDDITAEYEQNKAKIESEKAAKIVKVMQYINENATVGYELAYTLCKEDVSFEAKELAYRMIHRLKNISVEEKIEICQLYASALIEHKKSGNEIAKVYCQMAGLVYPVSKRENHCMCLKFYEKAYEYIDQPSYMLNEIIGFCNRFQIDELRLKCLQKKTILEVAKSNENH